MSWEYAAKLTHGMVFSCKFAVSEKTYWKLIYQAFKGFSFEKRDSVSVTENVYFDTVSSQYIE